MTTKLNLFLTLALGAQVALAAALFISGGQNAAPRTRGALLPMALDNIASVTVRDGKDNTVTLERENGQWRVPARQGFPADRQRLNDLLQGLHQARPEMPVATSDAARNRFDVARDDFARHLTLRTDNGTEVAFYLGKAAGAGRVYLRRAGEDAIQDVQVPLWKASAKTSDWLDPGYLRPKLAGVTHIRLPNVALKRQEDRWRAAELPEGRTTDQARVQNLLNHFRTLSWQTLLPKEAESDEPAFQVRLEGGGEPLIYRFYRHREGGGTQWRVKRSDGDYLLEVKDAEVKAFRDASVNSLSRESPPANTSAGQKDGHGAVSD